MKRPKRPLFIKKPSPNTKSVSVGTVRFPAVLIRKEKEWEKLLDSAEAMAGAGDAQNGGGPCLILPGPDSVSSEDFSEKLRRWEMSGQGKKMFFIPGAHFVSPEKVKLPILNLSDFTMNTAMTAMILYEQIYRGYRIMNHHPYHK